MTGKDRSYLYYEYMVFSLAVAELDESCKGFRHGVVSFYCKIVEVLFL